MQKLVQKINTSVMLRPYKSHFVANNKCKLSTFYTQLHLLVNQMTVINTFANLSNISPHL